MPREAHKSPLPPTSSLAAPYITIALQISALTHGGAGVFGKGFDSRDAVTEPTWTYSRRPLTDTPAPKFDQQRVYFIFS
ncbi:hypothetical protein EQU24_17055 [Methylotuvimicrobium buryatense]|uniref:Uncharacterized protein n=1 Tax=Methylotuvimicrobium buryatense TaxID=95641 RepID=A0A4P9UQN8_METBY|nr:hypothetical protein EQU24_17055 [Methylotuvimicrobium buryatense]